MPSNTDPARDARLRREARRQSFYVNKSSRRNALGDPIGYVVVDPDTGGLVSSEYGMDLDELEAWFQPE